MHVVAAGVHRRPSIPVLAYGRPVASVTGQGVHVGAEQHRRTGAVAQDADHPGAADPLDHLEAQRAQPVATMPAVRCSWDDSSGWACRSR